MHFLQMQNTHSRPKEPFSGPDMRLPPCCEKPGTRIHRLYQRLWEDCTPDTWKMLLDMRTVEHSDSSAEAGAVQSSPGPIMVKHIEESFAQEASVPAPAPRAHPESATIKSVPTLDLYKATYTDDLRGAVTDRPVTEPGRSREPNNMQDTPRSSTSFVAFEYRRSQVPKRPMTSRPTTYSGNQIASRFDFPVPRASSAARRSVAWSGAPDR
jgi:hypothetical protein